MNASRSYARTVRVLQPSRAEMARRNAPLLALRDEAVVSQFEIRGA